MANRPGRRVQLRAPWWASMRSVYVTACTDPAESRRVVEDAGFRWLSEPGHYVTATAESGLLVPATSVGMTTAQ